MSDQIKVRLHMEFGDGVEDFIDLEGSLGELRKEASDIIAERRPENYWSEQL